MLKRNKVSSEKETVILKRQSQEIQKGIHHFPLKLYDKMTARISLEATCELAFCASCSLPSKTKWICVSLLSHCCNFHSVSPLHLDRIWTVTICFLFFTLFPARITDSLLLCIFSAFQAGIFFPSFSPSHHHCYLERIWFNFHFKHEMFELAHNVSQLAEELVFKKKKKVSFSAK